MVVCPFCLPSSRLVYRSSAKIELPSESTALLPCVEVHDYLQWWGSTMSPASGCTDMSQATSTRTLEPATYRWS